MELLSEVLEGRLRGKFLRMKTENAHPPVTYDSLGRLLFGGYCFKTAWRLRFFFLCTGMRFRNCPHFSNVPESCSTLIDYEYLREHENRDVAAPARDLT